MSILLPDVSGSVSHSLVLEVSRLFKPGKLLTSSRAHVRHDLRPYVCTYDECELSDRLFDSRKEWQAHERFLHRRVLKWPDHPESEFTEDEYTDHVGQYHAQYFTELISDHGMLAAASTSKTLERDCPICNRACDGLESMDAHIAWHLECIALLTLPRATGLEKGPQKGDVDSEDIAQGTVSRLNDSQLSVVGDLVQQKNEETSSIRQGKRSVDRKSLTQDALTAHLSGSSTMPVSVMSSWIQEDMSHRSGSETVNSRHEVDLKAIDDDHSELPMARQAPGPRLSFGVRVGTRRLARDDELNVMRRFASHATHCRQCGDPYRTLNTGKELCDSGHVSACDVANYIYSKEGRLYSVVDKKSRDERKEIEIPFDCEVIRSLTKAFDRGLGLKGRPVQSPTPPVVVVRDAPVNKYTTRRERLEQIQKKGQSIYDISSPTGRQRTYGLTLLPDDRNIRRFARRELSRSISNTREKSRSRNNSTASDS